MSGVLSISFSKQFAGGARVEVDSLELPLAARVTVLFGRSGAGKTTFLRCLAGLERPDSGRIVAGGDTWFDSAANLWSAPRERRIGYVPQDYGLFPHLDVAANIAYGLKGLSRREGRQRVGRMLEWLGLASLEKRLPGTLSGGQQQRVALARAIARQPLLLLLDEPLAALDAPTRRRIRTDLSRLLREAGIPTVLVTHERADVLALGDDLVVLDQGRVVQSGEVREVFSRPVNLHAAEIVGVETVQPGRVTGIHDGLATVSVGDRPLKALAPDLSVTAAEVFVCIRAEDVVLARGPLPHTSPRNSLPAMVRQLTHEGPMVRIELDCGFPLWALLTPQACEELELAAGSQVHALVKAPHVHLVEH